MIHMRASDRLDTTVHTNKTSEPVGRVKIQTTSKNSQRHYTTKRLIRDLLSNTPNCYVGAEEFRGYYLRGMRERSMRSGMELVC